MGNSDGKTHNLTGMETAVAGWYERDAEWLRRRLRRNFRISAAEVEDIAQDTWLRLIRSPPAQIDHPRAFLARIALNLMRDRKRHERVREQVPVTRPVEHGWAGPRALGDQEAALELKNIILDLPAIYRDVFLLSRFRRMTNQDIATHLGVSVKTVEWRMGKALEMCMRRLGD